ncbi:uncharacterized protein LOC127291662 [Leptopilina boulardi]|uniref:uncharacterized protein LOC127291662 n=1 Tax=Leptopilina boulardi TaxID=63433 RepID=UPI0021F5BF76|nr:uncharacterized protein LOC127291662 [Leptopilina boulardi]
MPEMLMETVITLFNQIMEAALEFVFPEADVHGSFYCYEEKSSNHLKVEDEEIVNNEIKLLMKNLLSLPLLPSGEIHQLINGMTDQQEAQPFLRESLTLIENITVEKLSVYRNTDHLTDAFLLYEARLNVLLGKTPEIWNFIKKIIDLQSRTFKDKANIDSNNSRNCYSTKIIEKSKKNIKRFWENLDNGTYTPQEVLKCAFAICVEDAINIFELKKVTNVENEENNENNRNYENNEEGQIMEQAEPPVLPVLPAPPQNIQNQDMEINLNEELIPERNVPLMLPPTERAEIAVQTDREEPTMCCICQEMSATRTFVPCGHFIICNTCAEEFQERGETLCPHCRDPYLMITRIFNN